MKTTFLILLVLIVLMGIFVARRYFMHHETPAVGSVAPAFTLNSQEGVKVSLADFHGKWVVLYFYPKDMTPGCTIEAHNFERDLSKYEGLNAVILGVSVQDEASHQEFCTKEGLTFRLLADVDYSVSRAYGSLKDLGVAKISARNTFLIDPNGKIAKVYLAVDPVSHSENILKDLATLQK